MQCNVVFQIGQWTCRICLLLEATQQIQVSIESSLTEDFSIIPLKQTKYSCSWTRLVGGKLYNMMTKLNASSFLDISLQHNFHKYRATWSCHFFVQGFQFLDWLFSSRDGVSSSREISRVKEKLKTSASLGEDPILITKVFVISFAAQTKVLPFVLLH